MLFRLRSPLFASRLYLNATNPVFPAYSFNLLSKTRKYSTSHKELLTALDLEEENYGVYNGTWGGSGEIVESVSPIDGSVLARVRMVSLLQDVECEIV
jgi:hypothetical protein